MPQRPNEQESVANLQRYLRQLAYFDTTAPFSPVDGVFDAATQNALTAFQANQNLPATGTADAATWAALYDEYEKSRKIQSAPEPVHFFPPYPAGYDIGDGDDGMVVTIIQLLLRELLTLYGYDDGSLPVTGVFDDRTREAVENFQTVHRIPTTGRVNQDTWNRLANDHRPYVNRFPIE